MISIKTTLTAIESFSTKSKEGYTALLGIANELLSRTERLGQEVKADSDAISTQISRMCMIRDEASQKAGFYEHQMNGYYEDMKRAEAEIDYIVSHPKKESHTDSEGNTVTVEVVDEAALAAAQRKYESAKQNYYHFSNKYQEASAIVADATLALSQFESMGNAVRYVADSIEAMCYEIRKYISLMAEESDYNLNELMALIDKINEYLSSKPICYPTRIPTGDFSAK